MKKSKLTPKQKLFAAEYLVDLNATQAAIRAGYSKKTARSQGQRLLTNVDIAEAIQNSNYTRLAKTGLDAEFVLERLGELVNADPIDIFDTKTGAYKPIGDWPPEWRRMLTASDVQEIFEGYGKDRVKIGAIVKFKFIDRLKAYELLGKHTSIQAFKENLGLGGLDGGPVKVITADMDPQEASRIYKEMMGK